MKMYMNPMTGVVNNYDGWYYENVDGLAVNAVDLGEVIEVVQDYDGRWIEAE